MSEEFKRAHFRNCTYISSITSRGLVLRVTVFLLLLLAPAGVLAQDSLSLDHFLAAAKKRSPALRMAANALRSAEAARNELRTGGLPRISGVAGATYAPLPPVFGYDAALSNGGQVGAQIVLRQSLYDGGARSLRDDQSALDLRRLTLESTLAEQDLEFTVRGTFIEALRADAVAALLHEGLERLEGYADLVRRMNKSGLVTYTDVLKVDMQASSAHAAIAGAEQDAAAARVALGEAVGEILPAGAVLAGSLDRMVAATPEGGGEDSLPQPPLDMKVADVLVAHGDVERKLIARENLPVVEITADAGYLRSLENFRLPADERIRGFGYSVGIGVEIPILQWGAIGLRGEQKELAADDLRQKREMLRRSLAAEFRRTAGGLSTARTQLKILRAGSARAEENFLLTKSMYAGGGAPAMEVLAAHQALSDSRLAEIQARATILLLSARRDRLITHDSVPPP
jgi:outer membrane protein TolC